jgi:hypothetical protein
MSHDTLRAKFSLTTTDFQTIQALRHSLLDQQQQATLSSLLSDTLVSYLSNLLHTDFQVQTTIQPSRPQPQPTGPRPAMPVCQPSGLLSWYDAEADRTNIIGHLGSPAVLAALANQTFTSFRYQADPQTSISLYCRRDGKWYAAKRLNGQLRRRYLGRPENISVSKLNQITADLLAAE